MSLLFIAALLTACDERGGSDRPASAQNARPVELATRNPSKSPADAGTTGASAELSAEATDSLTYETTLDYFGIGFNVVASGKGSIGSVTIIPTGLENDNLPITRETDGPVELAEVGDLNVDGSPEIYVYTRSAGSGSYGGLIAYAVNAKKSLSEIYLPPITDDPTASEGFMGHDEFRVVENTLVRRFPVYRTEDTNSGPTGGTRQLQYELEAGEAGWVLKIDKVVEF
jgi:hypothetical protein